MKWFFASVLVFGVACKKESKFAPVVTPPAFKLVWSDEFDINGSPDASKWRFESGFVRNEEAQWYQKENAVCEGGNLVITGMRERKKSPDFVAGSTDWRYRREFIEYTSASLVMKQEHAFKYGKLEVRAKIDAQTGLWPAIWTLGVEGEWPSNGEVDVMEYYGDKILANFAFGGPVRWQAIWDAFSRPLSHFGGALWASQFHTWVLEWDAETMRITVDGEFMNSADLSQTFNKIDGKNPFRQPHFVLLNLAMGGKNGGSLSSTILPSKYLVDYVRIYQKK
jgi:beta-glucanase (GH16 family)